VSLAEGGKKKLTTVRRSRQERERRSVAQERRFSWNHPNPSVEKKNTLSRLKGCLEGRVIALSLSTTERKGSKEKKKAKENEQIVSDG